jgi:hypothetical protein
VSLGVDICRESRRILLAQADAKRSSPTPTFTPTGDAYDDVKVYADLLQPRCLDKTYAVSRLNMGNLLNVFCIKPKSNDPRQLQ